MRADNRNQSGFSHCGSRKHVACFSGQNYAICRLGPKLDRHQRGAAGRQAGFYGTYSRQRSIYGLRQRPALFAQRRPVHSWTKESLAEALSQHTSKTDNSILGIYSTQPALYVFVVQDGLYKMQRNSRTWAAVEMPLGVFGINDVEEDESGNIYLANETGVYVSADGGQNWKLHFRQGWISSLEVQDGAIIAGGKNGVYRSDDGGVNWTSLPIQQEMAFLFVKEGPPTYKVMCSGETLTAIRSESNDMKGRPGKFQISTDGGLNWQIHPADSYLKNLEDISSILLHEGKIFCSYKGFVICSEDNGNTWKTILQSKNSEPGMSLMLYLSGGVLYCTEGVFGC
jgi:hypothetical protein